MINKSSKQWYLCISLSCIFWLQALTIFYHTAAVTWQIRMIEGRFFCFSPFRSRRRFARRIGWEDGITNFLRNVLCVRFIYFQKKVVDRRFFNVRALRKDSMVGLLFVVEVIAVKWTAALAMEWNVSTWKIHGGSCSCKMDSAFPVELKFWFLFIF